MTRQELETYRTRLTDLHAQVSGQMQGLTDEAFREVGGEASGGLSNAPLHLADLASEHQTRETALGLVAIDRDLLEQIVSALARLDAGAYGTCEQCGDAIPAGRLEAVPYAVRCVACAEAAEGEADLPVEGMA